MFKKQFMKAINKQSGFTLIELLVVIAIISLLSSIVLASLQSAKLKATDTRIMAEYNQLKTAMELYYNETGDYPNPNQGVYCISATCRLGPATYQPLSAHTIPAFTYTPSDFTLDADNGGFLYSKASPGVVIFGTFAGGIVHATTGVWILSEGSGSN